jgi:hypothetical protein
MAYKVSMGVDIGPVTIGSNCPLQTDRFFNIQNMEDFSEWASFPYCTQGNGQFRRILGRFPAAKVFHHYQAKGQIYELQLRSSDLDIQISIHSGIYVVLIIPTVF